MKTFNDLLSSAASTTVTIPLANFADATNTVLGAVGIGVPISAAPHLEKLGLFSHSAAEKVAKVLLEPNGPTITSRWMDAVGEFSELYPKGVKLGYHRALHGHHFVTDFFRTLSDKNLSCVDFFKHLGTDIVTKNGLPLLPASTIQSISDVLGISVSKIAPWVSFNILDCASSILAVGHAGSNVIDIISGTAQWSAGYALNTFGMGAVEIVSGYYSCNPILMASGCADVVCGTVTACDYYSQPFFCGVPVADILQSTLVGTSIATLLTGIELYINRKKYTPTEKVKYLSERIATSGLLSALSVISAPLSITAAAGFMGYKLAKVCAQGQQSYIESIPLTDNFVRSIDAMVLNKYPNRTSLKQVRSLSKKYLESKSE